MSAFTGTSTLLRTVLRRERRGAFVWAALLALMCMATASRYQRTFPTEASRQAFASLAGSNRTLAAFGGPLYSTSIGGLVMFKVGSTMFILVGLMALLSVTRNTRAEEESGRGELVSAGSVGRSAPLASAMLATVINTGITAFASTLALLAMKLPAEGSIVFGLAVWSAGIVFTGIAAVTAQLSATARGANALAGGLLGASFGVRMMADGAGIGPLRWASPEGWALMMQPYGSDRAWITAVPIVVAAVLSIVAFRLLEGRDFGAGIIRPRPGAATGEGLRSPLALAWRLHRTPATSWTVGFLVLAAMLGGLARGMSTLAAGAGPQVRAMFERYGHGAALVDAFLWLGATMCGYVITLLAILAVLRLRAEETSGNAELVLSTPVSRSRWIGSHLTIALGSTAVILMLCGVLIGLVHGASVNDIGHQITRALAATTLQIPAVWTLAGLALVAFGWFPRQAVAIGWGAFVFLNLFGDVLGPGIGIDVAAAQRVIPFHAVPRVLTGEPFRIAPIAGLLAVTAAFVALGVAGFRRRDVTT